MHDNLPLERVHVASLPQPATMTPLLSLHDCELHLPDTKKHWQLVHPGDTSWHAAQAADASVVPPPESVVPPPPSPPPSPDEPPSDPPPEEVPPPVPISSASDGARSVQATHPSTHPVTARLRAVVMTSQRTTLRAF
jgi:hypothetical protein